MARIFLDINEFTGCTNTKWAKAAKFLREKYPEHNIGKAVYGWRRNDCHYIGFDTVWWKINPTNYDDAFVIKKMEEGNSTIIHVNENKILIGVIK
jgi:hypothetical protein